MGCFTLTYYPPWTVHLNCDIPSICNILYSCYISSSNDTFLIFYILSICNISPNCSPVVTIRLFCDILSTCAFSPLSDFSSTYKTFPLLLSCPLLDSSSLCDILSTMWHVFHDVKFCPLVTVLPPCDISSVCDILYTMWHVDHAVTFCPLVTLPPLTLTVHTHSMDEWDAWPNLT
jgi:hypothetical protein